MEDLQVTICGGGNMAHSSAACIGYHNPNIRLNVLTRKPHLWGKTMIGHTDKSTWSFKGDMIGNIDKVSNKAADVVVGSKVVLVTVPSNVHGDVLRAIAPYVDDNAFVGTLYGQGAFDLQARSIFGDLLAKKKITIFALQNVPLISKTKDYGKTVNIIGPKDHLYCASYPTNKVEQVSRIISLLYYIPTFIIPNFLCITLTPSNQIIHPGRTYSMFREWDGKSPYLLSEIPRLYDLDESSAKEIQLLDDELQAIKTAITKYYPEIDLSPVLPIKERIIKQYGKQISDPSTLQSVFSTNKGYDTLTFPTKSVPGGIIPNLESRYFWEDIPFGLCILKNYGDVFGVPMPNTERIIKWHEKFMGVKFLDPFNNLINVNLTGAPAKYGFTTKAELVASSLPKSSTKL